MLYKVIVYPVDLGSVIFRGVKKVQWEFGGRLLSLFLEGDLEGLMTVQYPGHQVARVSIFKEDSEEISK